MGRLYGRDLEARILFEQDDVLAVDKCPDLPTSGRTLEDPDCLQFALMERRGGMVWAVHQLDADTSGVNLFTTRRGLVEPLKRAMVEKRYRALVRGTPRWRAVTCQAPIGEVRPGCLGVVLGAGDEPLGGTRGETGGQGPSPSVSGPATRGGAGAEFDPAAASAPAAARAQRVRAARTRFERLGPCRGVDVEATDLRVWIDTGRTHQVRIHASHLGHPLLGEEWYVDPPCGLHGRQALHAERLVLGAPFGLELEAPLAADLARLVGG